jgi:hypothetical protein
MACIYANAFITLITAIGGDANSGIGVSQALRFNLLFDSQHNIPKAGFNWVERGWTMQELLFSRRNIILLDNTASWECCLQVKHASLPADDAQVRDDAFRVKLSSRARTLQYAT